MDSLGKMRGLPRNSFGHHSFFSTTLLCVNHASGDISSSSVISRLWCPPIGLQDLNRTRSMCRLHRPLRLPGRVPPSRPSPGTRPLVCIGSLVRNATWSLCLESPAGGLRTSYRRLAPSWARENSPRAGFWKRFNPAYISALECCTHIGS